MPTRLLLHASFIVIFVVLAACGSSDAPEDIEVTDLAGVWVEDYRANDAGELVPPYLIIADDGFMAYAEQPLLSPEIIWRTYAGYLQLNGGVFGSTIFSRMLSSDDGEQTSYIVVSGEAESADEIRLVFVLDDGNVETNFLRVAELEPGQDYSEWAGFWESRSGTGSEVFSIEILESGTGFGSFREECALDLTLSMFGSNVVWRRVEIVSSGCESANAYEGVGELLTQGSDTLDPSDGPFLGFFVATQLTAEGANEGVLLSGVRPTP